MENTLKEVGENVQGVEKLIPTTDYFSMDTGLNVQIPATFNKTDIKSRCLDLNSRLTDEERVSFEGKVIPFDIQEEVLKRPVVEDESWLGSFSYNLLGSTFNTTQDIATSSYRAGTQVSSGAGAWAASVVARLKGYPVKEGDVKQAAMEGYEAVNPDYKETKIKLAPAKTGSAEWWGQGLGSTAVPLIVGLATGNMMPLSAAFGFSSYADTTETLLDYGDSLMAANIKGIAAGSLETALELMTISKVATKVGMPRLKRYATRFVVGSGQETAQNIKDMVILGDADTRTSEQKKADLLSSLVFGGIGEIVGLGVRDVATRKQQKDIQTKAEKEGMSEGLAKELSLTATLDEKPNYEGVKKELKAELNKRQDQRRAVVYDQFIEEGDAPELAAKKANELIPSVEEVESEIIDDLEKGTLLTEDEKENLKQAYLEAVNSAGEEAGLYLAANEEIRNLIQNAGRSEQEAKDYAAYMTGLMIKDYQILKDTGFEGTFEDVKEKFYKLNKITDYAFEDESEAWAEYDARNQTEYNEEQDMMEGKPSHKLFSKDYGFDPDTYFEQPEVIENIQKSKESFSEALDEMVWGQDKTGKKPVVLFRPTKIWTMVGLPDRKISFDKSKIRKVIKEHGLTIDDLKTLPEKLANPEFIFESATDDTAYVGVLDRNNEPFVAVVKPVGSDLKVTNIIKSAYNKHEGFVDAQIEAGRLLYDKTKPTEFRPHRALIAQGIPQSDNNNINQENKNVNGKLYSKTFDNTMNDKAKEYFGTTHNLKEAGYILENGELLDFSGKKQGASGGYRTIDHQDIKDAFDVQDDGEAESLVAFVNNGNIRFMPETNGFYMANMPTPEQMKVIKRVFEKDFGKGEIELYHDASDWGNRDKVFYRQYERGTDFKTIERDIIAFFNGNTSKANQYLSQSQGKVLGSYDELTREVELFKGQNPSTLMHELSHHFLLNHLNLMESMGLKDRNSEVFKFLSEVGGHEINSVSDMTRADKENLTEAFINYMNTNEAPNLATKSIFQRAKEWVIDQYRIHQTDASPEIREYFDGLISRESAMPDVSSMVNRTAEIREILKQAINGEQVSFKGLGKKELEQLQKALHTRIRRKGKSLRDELIETGGIKEGTELAKALGFDVLKKDKMFSTKDTAIETEQELIDWLTEKGYIVGVQEGESYSDTERRWEEVLSLIDNAENTYTVKESMINNERETAIRNQAHAQEIVDELLKDNALGLKDIHDLDNLLTRTISKKDDVDIIKVNTNAVRYLNERMRSLTKDTKELLRNKDKEFKSKREEQYQAQNDLKDFIRNLPINGKHKVSLMGNIQRVKDYDSLQKVVNEIKPRVQGFIEQEIKTLLSNKIDAIVRSSKPKERKKQKFNYEYNTFFEELREINKLTKEQAQDKLKEIFEMLGEDVEFDGTDLLKNMFLTYKSNGMNSSVELMKQLSDELDNIYNEALQDRMDTLERLGQEREAKIKEAVDYIENTKAVNKLNQKLLKMTNLNSNLSELFGKKWADKHKMDSLLIKQDMETNKALDDVIREGKDIYGLKNREEFVKLANDMRVTKEEYTLNNYRDDMSEQISKMQIMDIYLTIKNKGSAEAYRRLYEDFDELGNQTTTQIEDLLSYLTEEDKKFADMLQKRVNDLYKAENKVYVKLYGIDMPKHENYWMRTSDRAERPLMDIKQFMNVDMLPSFMKERSKAPSVRPDDVFKKFARRIHDSKYMTEVFEQYKDIYDLVHSNRVKKAIVKKYDNDRYKVLNQSLKRISLGGVNDSYNELNNMLGKAITNWVVSKISISETVFIKQLASFTNYMENVPVSDFAKYEAEFLANPKEAIEFMKGFAGEYLDHRFKSGIQNEVLQRIMQSKPEDYSKATGMYQKYLNAVTAPVRFGDIGAIYLGGYARARYLLEQGVPLEKARKMFIEETESAQQSGNKAELSEFQHNALWRVFTAFKNTNLQYMRKMQDSYIQFTRGEISAQQFGKTWGNYMVIQSVLYQVLTNIGTWWRDDDDEELDWFKDVWMRILTAPVAGFPIIGDITEGVFAENYWGLNISGKQDMEAFIGAARDAIDGEYDAKKIAKGSMSLISFFRPIPDRMIKGVINLVED